MLAVVAVKEHLRRSLACLGLEVQMEPVDGGCRRQAPSQCPTVLRTVQEPLFFLAGAACVKGTLRWCRGGLSLVSAFMAVDVEAGLRECRRRRAVSDHPHDGSGVFFLAGVAGCEWILLAHLPVSRWVVGVVVGGVLVLIPRQSRVRPWSHGTGMIILAD